VEKVLPRLKEAARRNEEAAREEFRRQCQAEEAAREAKRLRHNDLCLAWKDKDVATLCKMLGVEASSFEELNDLLRGRAVFAGRQDDLGGRRDYSCRELTTYQFTDESGWYIQWKETTGSWWGKD
jgi:hypothetical protein